MKIFDFEQRSEEWWQIRRGIPTASSFSNLITPKTLKISASADDYIYELLGERFRISPPVEAYKSAAMQNGIDTEAEARSFYAMEKNVDLTSVGFCLSDCGRWGCSPDALVGDLGGLEMKCPIEKTHCKYLLGGTLPDEYKAQVHGSLIVTARPWWDFMSYCPGFPPFIIRVEPNEYTAALRDALESFHARYMAAVSKIQELGAIEPPSDKSSSSAGSAGKPSAELAVAA